MKPDDRERIARSINLPMNLIRFELDILEKAGKKDSVDYKALANQQYQLYLIQKNFIDVTK
jgi:hypothetical protein